MVGVRVDGGYSPHECVVAYPPGMSHTRAVLGQPPAEVRRRPPPRLVSPFACGLQRMNAERTTGELGAMPLSCASPFCYACDRRRRGRVMEPAGVVAPGPDSCAWFVTLGPGEEVDGEWRGRRVHPDAVYSELADFRKGLLAEWLAAGLEGGVWLPEVVPGREGASTLFPCPMRRLGPRRQGYKVRAQVRGCGKSQERRVFWFRRRFSIAHHSPLWAALRVGHTLKYHLERDRVRMSSEPAMSLVRWRRTLGKAPPAALDAASACWAGSCHCCGGSGTLPVGHLHIHLLAFGPRFAFTSSQVGDVLAGHVLRDIQGGGLHEFFRKHGYANVNLKRIDATDIDLVRAYVSKVSKYLAKCVEHGASSEPIGGLQAHQGAAFYQGAYLRLYGRSIRCGGSVGSCYGVRARRRDATLVVHGSIASDDAPDLAGSAASVVVWGDGCQPGSACLPVLGCPGTSDVQGDPSDSPPILGIGHNFQPAALVPPRRLPRQASGGSIGRWVSSLAYLRGGKLLVGARAKCRVALAHSRAAWRSSWACSYRASLGGDSAAWWSERARLYLERSADWLLGAGEWSEVGGFWSEHDGAGFVATGGGGQRVAHLVTSLHVLAGRICDNQDSGVCGYSVVHNTECCDVQKVRVKAAFSSVCSDIA